MDDHSFRRMAVDSAQRYFEHLVKTNRGLAVTEVSNITKEGKEVFLHLQGRLSSAGLETLKLRIYADEYEPWEIHPVEYQRENSVLILRPRQELFDYLPSGKCRDIAVISDLRFLVERVRDWYKNERPPISLPARPSDAILPALSDMAGGTPTPEQYMAVCNVLSSPFSYVWGAPGTGKTRFVLANCVLNYLRHNKQVLLTAPTNNALEQMISGVLDVLRSCGVPDSCAYRFGVPSATFAAQYPDACEQRSMEAQRAALTSEIKELSRQLESAEEYVSLQSALSQMADLCHQLDGVSAQFRSARVPEHEIQFARSGAKHAQEEEARLERTVKDLTVWVESFPGRMSRFFRPSLYSKRSALLDESLQALKIAAASHFSAAQYLRGLEQRNQTASKHYNTQLEKLCAQYSKVFHDSPIPELSISGQIPLSAFPSHLLSVHDIIKTRATKLPISDTADIAKIKEKLSARTAALDKININSRTRWSTVQIWAMTIDRFIAFSEAPSEFDPAHVFMDEAAYCSLIKGYPLLSLGRPVTLLGDHAQLPPVCEISGQILNREFCPEFLWAQSAIHLDSVFRKSEIVLYEEYQNSAQPSFTNLQLNTLSVTHRFGPGLSHALSDFIYVHGLTSARSKETSIKYIHAPASSKDLKRTSSTECRMIRSLSLELSAKGVDFAILAPYKNQVALLSKTMPTLSAAGKIMTIHASQGREFHTVIISVTDTSDKYFTDSNLSIGCALLNTAISRVKSNLILVLDCDYWIIQKRQMIGALLRLATPY